MADSLNQFMLNMGPVYKKKQEQNTRRETNKAKAAENQYKRNRKQLLQTFRIRNNKSTTHGFKFAEPPANLTEENIKDIYAMRNSRMSKRYRHEGNTKGRYEFTRERPAVHPGRYGLSPKLAPIFANLHARSNSRNEFKAKLDRRAAAGILRPANYTVMLQKFNALYPEGVSETYETKDLLNMSVQEIDDLSKEEFDSLLRKLTKEETLQLIAKLS